MKFLKIIIAKLVFFALVLTWGISECFAVPNFYSTSDPTGHWFVSTNVDTTGDGQLSSFNTSNFIQAVSEPSRPDFIADIASGTHGGIGTWTFFVFRQTFDLTGFDSATADLKFQWAADDSGQGGDRGTWTPKFSLNGGGFIVYPGSPTSTYDYSSVVDLSSGFVSGLNIIDFYVEGNGVTDGFELKTTGFTANESASSNAVPEPATIMLLGFGMFGLAVYGKRRTNKINS